ncbi:MAG: hypothetical protein EU547_07335 [Promethearchaeota archaeon]|nr:MAG: hypothetical protein EU547_07335 [Candidatus Lokiarchaeota archaeon]
MSDQFREGNEFEKKLILKTLESISNDIISYIKENLDQLFLKIPQSNSIFKYPIIFFIPNQLIETIHNLQNKTKIKEAGIYLGFIKRGKFYLSIEAAEYFIAKNLISENDKIYVNEKGTKAILYGNNLKREIITKSPKKLYNNKIYFIMNEFNELLAIGLSKGKKNLNNLKAKQEIVINLIDKGYYLRKKQ